MIGAEDHAEDAVRVVDIIGRLIDAPA